MHNILPNQSHNMSLKRNKNLYETSHLLKYLSSRGITLFKLAANLNISYVACKKWLLRPQQYLTYSHMVLIAGVTDTPILYIIGLIDGRLYTHVDKWYDEQEHSISIKFLKDEQLPTKSKG